MKKKILISAFLLCSSISIFPLSFILNNSKSEIKKINEIIEESQAISNTSSTLSSENNFFRDKIYTTIFTNNFTEPVVSPNRDIPGFLGAWDTNTIGQFPTAIGWTTPSLFQSWSVELKDHPSLEVGVPINFTPGLVTALYSDNIHSSVKRNQIFAIVANTANLSARRYWILRYNAIDGSPIKDDNAEMPLMTNAPIPQMTTQNGNGSAFALTNDILNNRYLAFYPGLLSDLKNDIFGFELTNDNKIKWLDNATYFSGHSNWSNSISSTASYDYDRDNFVLGLTPFVNKRGSNGASIALMISTPPAFSEDNGKLNFRILDLNDNFSAINGFTSEIILGRNRGDFTNSNRGRISVPNNLISLNTVQKHINPHLQFFDFIDDSNINTYKVQMVVPILKGDEWVFMYLSSVSDMNNSYHVSWGLLGSLGQGSFFRSHAFSANTMPPVISYNKQSPNEIIITSQTNNTSDKRFSANIFTFVTMPFNGDWSPSIKHIADLDQTQPSNNWKAKNIVIKMPWGEDIYSWSLPYGQNHQGILKEDGSFKQLQSLNSGGAYHESFQTTASWLNWLEGQSNAKFPSEITDAELLTIGTGAKNFFERPTITYPSGATNTFFLEMYGKPIRDDSKGIIQGIFNFKQDYKMDGVQFYNYESKIAFKVTGLRKGVGVATSINQNNSILNNLPSELTTENISKYIDIISIPPNAIIDEKSWEITNQNNVEGSATVSVKIHPFYDDDGKLVNNPAITKKFTTNVSGLKKMSGTTAINASTDVSNLTVWDINDSNAGNLIEVNDLIPGSSNDDITFSVRNQAPLIGELIINTSINAGSYYDPSNKGLPSIIGGNSLELPIKIEGFKLIPDTGTLVIPKNGPHNGILSSSINEDNIIDYFIIENEVPGSTYDLEITGRSNSDDTSPFIGGWVSFSIVFDKEYDTNGNIINGLKKDITIHGFDLLLTQNNFIPLIGGVVGGSVALILLIIILILLIKYIKEKKRFKGRFSDSPPKTSEIVLPYSSSVSNSNSPIMISSQNDDIGDKPLPPKIPKLY